MCTCVRNAGTSIKSSHDLLKNDPKLSSEAAVEVKPTAGSSKHGHDDKHSSKHSHKHKHGATLGREGTAAHQQGDDDDDDDAAVPAKSAKPAKSSSAAASAAADAGDSSALGALRKKLGGAGPGDDFGKQMIASMRSSLVAGAAVGSAGSASAASARYIPPAVVFVTSTSTPYRTHPITNHPTTPSPRRPTSLWA
jgi:hypothetical protein